MTQEIQVLIQPTVIPNLFTGVTEKLISKNCSCEHILKYI